MILQWEGKSDSPQKTRRIIPVVSWREYIIPVPSGYVKIAIGNDH